MKNDSNNYLYGKNPIIEAILSDNIRIEKIYCCYGRNNSQIVTLAKKNKIHITTLDKNKFRELEKKILPNNSINSQGIVAQKSLVNIISLQEFYSIINLKKKPILIIMDGITDPHNLGAISRTIECSGANGIIISDKGNSPINPTSIKVSAGALNHLNIIKSNNLINTCKHLKENGF